MRFGSSTRGSGQRCSRYWAVIPHRGARNAADVFPTRGVLVDVTLPFRRGLQVGVSVSGQVQLGSIVLSARADSVPNVWIRRRVVINGGSGRFLRASFLEGEQSRGWNRGSLEKGRVFDFSSVDSFGRFVRDYFGKDKVIRFEVNSR